MFRNVAEHAEEQRDVIIDHPNRDKVSSKATRAIVVLLLQPSADDLGVMGLNLMARGRRLQVTEQAVRSTALALRELRGTDTLLPGPHRRRTAPKPAAKASRRAA